jgi:pimeloyl-ACP methyl ester carboxylesterase
MKLKSTSKLIAAILIVMLINMHAFAQIKSDSTIKNTIHSKTIVFVTGAFVSNACWDEWKAYFESKGYTCIAPAWPYKDGTAAELRARQPKDTALARFTLDSLVNFYAAVIKKCPEKPIVIGHSLGGMITQILVNRNLAAAGIAIHPAPPKGVIPYERSFLRAGLGVLGIFTSTDKTYLMSFPKWQYAFTNGMSLEVQHSSYDHLIVPESKTVARGALSKAGSVDFKKKHAPLLITSGSKDDILPPHLNFRNYKKYAANGSITEYKEFEGRNHFVLGQPTWKEDADYMLEWIDKHSDTKTYTSTQISN